MFILVCLPAVADVPLRPVNTYSIVARDAETGELGVAVQSHWFSVGSNVIWAEPGVGAVATQFHKRFGMIFDTKIKYAPAPCRLTAVTADH